MVVHRMKPKTIAEIQPLDWWGLEKHSIPAIVGGAAPQASPLANDDSYTTDDASIVTADLLINDTPGDLPLAVTAVNGSSAAVGNQIILASGALLLVNADGSFTYDPHHAF